MSGLGEELSASEERLCAKELEKQAFNLLGLLFCDFTLE